MHIPFHPLTLQDKERVLRYTSGMHLQNCDLSFANLYGWQLLYQTEVAELDGFLLLRFRTQGHPAYLMPVGQGDIHCVMQALHEDACRQGHPFLMLGVSGPWLEAATRHEQIEYTLTANRDYADYIYLRQSLATLSGKKLQPKRNHVNKFRRLYPDYEYRPLTPDLVPACLRLSEEWGSARTAPDVQRSVASEHTMTGRVLANMDTLDITGGTLFVDGQLIAFTFGAPVNGDTFDVCVEKADTRYEGAYAAINNEFASRLPERFIYINREEDLGIEGLRKAKLSYYPHLLLEKFSVWSACTVSHHPGEQSTSCRESHLKWQTRALWQQCFSDSNDFLQLYFNKKYAPSLNSFIEENGQVVSALQRLPYRMHWENTDIPVGYISGACTSPERRGRGLMRRLLGQAHRRMYADGQWFSLLIPADETLRQYYARSGYAAGRIPAYMPPASPVPDTPLSYTVVRHREDRDCIQLKEWIEECMPPRPCFIRQSDKDLDIVLDDLFLSGGVLIRATNAKGQTEGILPAVPENDEDIRILDIFAQPQTAVAQALCREAAHALQRSGEIMRRETTVQVRVLQTEKALTHYAAEHPEETLTFRFKDADIPENNGTYTLANGKCLYTSDTAGDTLPLYTPQQLALLLFRNRWPHLSLMLD